MKSSFVVYIDESRDEGFVFRPDGTASFRWFVLSAAVIRQANDLQMVSCPKAVREVLPKPGGIGVMRLNAEDNVSPALFFCAIADLIAGGRIARQGERRGARYRFNGEGNG